MADHVLFRLAQHNPPITWDFLSQAARHQPPRKTNPPSQHDWEGLSTFTTYQAVRALGLLFRWKPGEWVVVLHIPESAPFTYDGPNAHGHVMIYDHEGKMIREDGADSIRLNYVVQVVHGPSVESVAL